jgi:hypothetical protein
MNKGEISGSHGGEYKDDINKACFLTSGKLFSIMQYTILQKMHAGRTKYIDGPCATPGGSGFGTPALNPLRGWVISTHTSYSGGLGF